MGLVERVANLDGEKNKTNVVPHAKLVRWCKLWVVLKMATSANYELFKLSGPRDPYPGKNGVVEEGALADLLLMDGNPLENIDLMEKSTKIR